MTTESWYETRKRELFAMAPEELRAEKARVDELNAKLAPMVEKMREASARFEAFIAHLASQAVVRESDPTWKRYYRKIMQDALARASAYEKGE